MVLFFFASIPARHLMACVFLLRVATHDAADHPVPSGHLSDGGVVARRLPGLAGGDGVRSGHGNIQTESSLIRGQACPDNPIDLSLSPIGLASHREKE
jgi:hypothetical protein